MSDDTGKEQGSNGSGSRYSRGQSGNPSGRPRGSRNRVTMAVEALLEGQAEAIAAKAVEMALEGDTTALRLVMERVVPLRRGKPVHFDFPPIEHAGDVSAALGSILKATARGELTPDEAVTIANVLEAKRKALETLDLETRLAALEKASQERRGIHPAKAADQVDSFRLVGGLRVHALASAVTSSASAATSTALGSKVSPIQSFISAWFSCAGSASAARNSS